jgi:hypothetical protein
VIRIKANIRDTSHTELICGRLRFDGAADSLVTAALPKAIVLSIGRKDVFDRMRMLVGPAPVHHGPGDLHSSDGNASQGHLAGIPRHMKNAARSHRGPRLTVGQGAIVRSAQIRTKHRNLRQAILSESAHTPFVYARSMRAISGLFSVGPCSLRRSSRNQTSSLSVSLGLGIRPVAFSHRPSFVSKMDSRHSKTLQLRYGAIMDGA